MKYPAYPQYKESGIDWLGDVPEHWEVLKTKHPFSIQLGKMLQPDVGSSADEEVPYLKAQHVQWEKVRVDDLPTMWASQSDHTKYAVTDGDLLVCDGGDVGRAGIVRNPAPDVIVQNALHRVRGKGLNDPRMLMYVLEHAASQSWFEILCNRATIAHFTSEKFGALDLPLPTPTEQWLIADFLEAKTATLDTLMAKKRALIEKLKEKRTALISRTVTHGLPPEAARTAGLNPHPKFKASGIDWVGDIPEHWSTPPLSTRYQVELGKMLNEGRVTGDYLVPYLRNIDAQWDRINMDDLPEMDIRPDEYGRFTVRRGDLLVCEGGEVGRSAIVGAVASCLGYQKALHRLRPVGLDENPRFMFFTLAWAAAMGVFNAGGNPNTIAHLTGEKLRSYRFAKPLMPEQSAIADILDRETTKIDRLIEKVQAAIEKLQEYRVALITAAVTGKIDVRGCVQ